MSEDEFSRKGLNPAVPSWMYIRYDRLCMASLVSETPADDLLNSFPESPYFFATGCPKEPPPMDDGEVLSRSLEGPDGRLDLLLPECEDSVLLSDERAAQLYHHGLCQTGIPSEGIWLGKLFGCLAWNPADNLSALLEGSGMGRGSGYGKVILFNEHFVVYGIPSIVSAIDSTTVATVERVRGRLQAPSGKEGSMAGDGWVMEDDRPANPGYKAEKSPQQKKSMELVFQAAGFDPRTNPIRIHLGGDLMAVGGVGASAAVCVSVARALNEEFRLGFDDGKINEVAFTGDSAYAGTPSGIDNTASTYGGLLWFVKNLQGGPNTMEKLKIRKPLRIVMGNTLLTANTEAAVGGVRKRREAQPEKYDAIFARARELAGKARSALERYDVAEVGRLMNENHSLLQQVDVSHPDLDELVEIARKNGATGAKMTGGGLGGYMVALTPEKATQERVAAAMEEAGFKALKTVIGV